MEEHYLQGFFQHAVALGRSVAQALLPSLPSLAAAAAAQGPGGGGGNGVGEQAALCAACMSLMATILGWDFHRTGNLHANIHMLVGGWVMSVCQGANLHEVVKQSRS